MRKMRRILSLMRNNQRFRSLSCIDCLLVVRSEVALIFVGICLFPVYEQMLSIRYFLTNADAYSSQAPWLLRLIMRC